MKLNPLTRSIVCEQCNAEFHVNGELMDAARSAVVEHGWNYVWTHLFGGPAVNGRPATAHYYCPRCKHDFDCCYSGKVSR